jgi:hypothetical protein
MIRSLTLLTLLSYTAFAQTHYSPRPALPSGYCQVGCQGRRSVPAFDFISAARKYGDPNTGRPLGPTVMIPKDSNNPRPNQSVNTESFLRELADAEQFAASMCGQSLNNNSNNDIIDVIAPCADTEKILQADAADITRAHSLRGNAPMTDQVAQQAYEYAKNPNNQRNLNEKQFCVFVPAVGRNNSNALHNQDCNPYDLTLGTKSTLSVGMTSKTCRGITAPRFIPNSRQVMGSGTIECHKGIPANTTTTTSSEVNFAIWAFNNQFTLLGINSNQTGRLGAHSSYRSRTMYLGDSICQQNKVTPDIRINERCAADRIRRSASVTFMVGPIPIGVEAGAQGEIGTSEFGRVIPMWSNGKVGPYVNTGGWASAYINLLIVRGGVEAMLTFFEDNYELSALSAVMHLPVGNGVTQEGFYFSAQQTGVNKINALSGRINAFAEVPVPKWLGFRWKKFRVKIFEWAGINRAGYVIDKRESAAPLMMLQRN